MTCGNSIIELSSITDPQPLVQAYGQIASGTVSSIAHIHNVQLHTRTIYMCIYDNFTNTSSIQTIYNTNNPYSEFEPGIPEIIYTFNGTITSDIIFYPYNLIFFTYADTDTNSSVLYQRILTNYVEDVNMCAVLPPDRGIRTPNSTFYPEPDKVIKIVFGSNVNNSCIHLYYDGIMYRIISSTLNMNLNIYQ